MDKVKIGDLEFSDDGEKVGISIRDLEGRIKDDQGQKEFYWLSPDGTRQLKDWLVARDKKRTETVKG